MNSATLQSGSDPFGIIAKTIEAAMNREATKAKLEREDRDANDAWRAATYDAANYSSDDTVRAEAKALIANAQARAEETGRKLAEFNRNQAVQKIRQTGKTLPQLVREAADKRDWKAAAEWLKWAEDDDAISLMRRCEDCARHNWTQRHTASYGEDHERLQRDVIAWALECADPAALFREDA